MSVYSDVVAVGNVGAVVSNVASQACESQAGSQWLSSYIDPAHGNCATVPDEDNTYSFAVQSKFLTQIDSSFFFQPTLSADAAAALPPTLS